MSIYVEILIRAPMDALWAHTQTPELHERWDLRFSEIEYAPTSSETDPRRFRYATRLGFGLEVRGEGESVGQRNLADGSRSSALKFSSADRQSIIREGRGYWKYVPTADGIRFDYLGSHQHLAVDIELSVDQEGGIRLRSGAQRFYEGRIGFDFPMALSGIADVREWYDEKARRFRITVDVRNPTWGPLFGYRGSFDVEWREVRAGEVPSHILPRRQESRE